MFAYDIGDADLPATILGSDRLENRLTAQRVRAVAVNALDEIALVGEFDYDINLLGQNQSAVEINLSDIADHLRHGRFVAKLDAAGHILWKQFGDNASAIRSSRQRCMSADKGDDVPTMSVITPLASNVMFTYVSPQLQAPLSGL